MILECRRRGDSLFLFKGGILAFSVRNGIFGLTAGLSAMRIDRWLGRMLYGGFGLMKVFGFSLGAVGRKIVDGGILFWWVRYVIYSWGSGC